MLPRRMIDPKASRPRPTRHEPLLPATSHPRHRVNIIFKLALLRIDLDRIHRAPAGASERSDRVGVASPDPSADHVARPGTPPIQSTLGAQQVRR